MFDVPLSSPWALMFLSVMAGAGQPVLCGPFQYQGYVALIVVPLDSAVSAPF